VGTSAEQQASRSSARPPAWAPSHRQLVPASHSARCAVLSLDAHSDADAGAAWRRAVRSCFRRPWRQQPGGAQPRAGHTHQRLVRTLSATLHLAVLRARQGFRRQRQTLTLPHSACALLCHLHRPGALPRTARVGVLGGGQLGRMLAIAAVRA
jgi:hypothetical protein